MKIVSSLLFIFAIIFIFSSQDAFAKLDKADKVVVIKSKRVLFLLKEGEIIKGYKIALGKDPVGHKTRLGDNKTPEGTYTLSSRKQSDKYHLTIFISYPSESDILNAKNIGVSPGGSIAIHGLPKGMASLNKLHRKMDWTSGCIALTNDEMEEIWHLVEDGVPIEIKP